MTQNKFQLDCEKTEPMLVGTKQKLFFILVKSLQLDDTIVPFSDSVKIKPRHSPLYFINTLIVMISSRSSSNVVVVVVVVM